LQRQLPEEGWDDLSIELFLQEVALMDSNNFIGARPFSWFCTMVGSTYSIRHFDPRIAQRMWG